MPPVRNTPPGKPTKTERTHEENQERAYIAASRRSDRSLEARVESARRASEIHKKRTGRALRVTEQDVLNEEMYEEEEEDLPSQYRRLTAHLQTGSMDFNRRFHAYIQTQAGTRMALAYQDPAFIASMQPSSTPFLNPHYMQMVPTHLLNPQASQQPQSYRQAPYPMPMTAHQRAASISHPQEMMGNRPSYFQPAHPGFRQFDQRRMSLPAQVASTPMDMQAHSIQPTLSRTSTSSQIMIKQESPVQSPMRPPDTPSSLASGDRMAMMQPDNQMQSDFFSLPHTPLCSDQSMSPQFNNSPFSYALPPESQMVLGPGLQQAGFPAHMLMAGSDMVPQQNFYGYQPNPEPKLKFSNENPFSTDGGMMPNNLHLDTAMDNLTMQVPQSAMSTGSSAVASPFSPMFNLDYTGLDQAVVDQARTTGITKDSSDQGSSNPDWEDFVDLDPQQQQQQQQYQQQNMW